MGEESWGERPHAAPQAWLWEVSSPAVEVCCSHPHRRKTGTSPRVGECRAVELGPKELSHLWVLQLKKQQG